MRHTLKALAIALALTLTLQPAAALAAPPVSGGVQPRVLTLKNGLKVLHVERHNIPLVVMSLTLNAGSILEPAEHAGLASLTASMLSEGTAHHTSQKLSEEVEYTGASLGASASYDYATLSLSTLKKDLDRNMALLSEVLLTPTFPEAELKRKVTLMKGALRQNEDDPNYLSTRELRKMVFGAHPYARLVSGSAETLETITREDLLSFYHAHYTPEGAILAVAGDLSAAELDALLSKYLAKWAQPKKASSRAAHPALPTIPPTARQVLVLDRDLSQATINLGHLGVRRSDPDYYALLVMNYTLGGGGFSSRLMDRVRDQLGLAYGIYSTFSADMHSGLFLINVQTKNASANTVIKETLDLLKALQHDGITEAELSEAKAYLIGSFPRKLDTTSKITAFLSATEFYGLGPDYQQKYPGYINSVTREDVLRVARKYLHPDNLAISIATDNTKAQIPHPDKILKRSLKD